MWRNVVLVTARRMAGSQEERWTLQRLSLSIVAALYQCGLGASIVLQLASLAVSATQVAHATQQTIRSGSTLATHVDGPESLWLSHVTLFARLVIWRSLPLRPDHDTHGGGDSTLSGLALLMYCLKLLIRSLNLALIVTI